MAAQCVLQTTRKMSPSRRPSTLLFGNLTCTRWADRALFVAQMLTKVDSQDQISREELKKLLFDEVMAFQVTRCASVRTTDC